MNKTAWFGPWMLTACGAAPQDAWDLPPQGDSLVAPPPGAVELEMLTPVQAGAWAVARVYVPWSSPGDTVFVPFTNQQGASPFCPPALSGQCLDLTGNLVHLGRGVTDATGNAFVGFQIPAQTEAFGLQAVVPSSQGRQFSPSLVFTLDTPQVFEGDYTIEEPADLDGLSAYTEIAGNLHVEMATFPSLAGLEHLTHIHGNLEIFRGDLVHLEGLSGLESIGGDLRIAEAFALARTHEHVYLEVSGLPPSRLLDYFPKLQVLEGKVVFGTDFPVLRSITDNVQAIRELPLRESFVHDILVGAASRLLARAA